MGVENNNEKKHFHLKRFFYICGSQGFSFFAIAVLVCGFYGFFVGTVLPITTIAKVGGIAFLLGCLIGLTKL